VIRVPFSGQYSKLRRRCSCAFKRSCAEPSARGRERGVSINCDESSCRQQHHSAVCTNPFQVSLACVCVCVCGCVLDSQTARRRWPGDDLGSGVIRPAMPWWRSDSVSKKPTNSQAAESSGSSRLPKPSIVSAQPQHIGPQRTNDAGNAAAAGGHDDLSFAQSKRSNSYVESLRGAGKSSACFL
jgi:hypothetical protein